MVVVPREINSLILKYVVKEVNRKCPEKVDNLVAGTVLAYLGGPTLKWGDKRERMRERIRSAFLKLVESYWEGVREIKDMEKRHRKEDRAREKAAEKEKRERENRVETIDLLELSEDEEEEDEKEKEKRKAKEEKKREKDRLKEEKVIEREREREREKKESANRHLVRNVRISLSLIIPWRNMTQDESDKAEIEILRREFADWVGQLQL